MNHGTTVDSFSGADNSPRGKLDYAGLSRIPLKSTFSMKWPDEMGVGRDGQTVLSDLRDRVVVPMAAGRSCRDVGTFRRSGNRPPTPAVIRARVVDWQSTGYARGVS